jgi:hypothetical protein
LKREATGRTHPEETAFALATRHRPAQNPDEGKDALERQSSVSTESFERAVRQSLPDRAKQVGWIEGVEPKQNDVRVRSWRAASQVLPKSGEILRRRVGAWFVNSCGCCHVSHLALYYGPHGQAVKLGTSETPPEDS